MSDQLEGYTSSDAYEIVRKIAWGKYADIFEGVRVVDLKKCIIKPAKQVGKRRLRKEIKMLHHLEGGTNILKLYDIVQDTQVETPSLVFEYIDNVNFRTLYPRFRKEDVQYYMNELLKAIEFSHSKGIMHRDIRPHNIMIDHGQRKLRLFGWDYAELYIPNTRYSVRVGIYARAPELLLHYEEYDCSVDMWSFGVVFASIIFRKEPFFHGVSNLSCLQSIARVLGTKGLLNYVEKYDIETDPDGVDALVHSEGRTWQSFVTEDNRRFQSTEAVDLLDKMFRWDHKQRITAADALKHPYFN
ncbi:casein kinase II subunit alpha [Trichoderma chlorosporum]